MEMIFQTYKYTLARTTAYTLISDEKKLLEQEIKDKVDKSQMKSFHTKVDIVTYLAEYENAKDSLDNHNVEPSLLGKNGRPYLFHPNVYADLIDRDRIRTYSCHKYGFSYIEEIAFKRRKWISFWAIPRVEQMVSEDQDARNVWLIRTRRAG